MRFAQHRSAIPSSIVLPSPWRRYAVTLVIVAIVVMGLVFARSINRPVQGDDWSRYHDRSFRVVHVVDGDTFDIDIPNGDKLVTRIRLWGVDTPEVAHGKQSAMYFGPEAAAFTERTLSGRNVHVVLSPKRTRGKFGRLLAYVFLKRGGRMFNEMLLEEGYAYADLRFQHHYYDRFKGFEKRARKAAVGLWADVTLDKTPPWKQRFESRAGKAGD